MASAATLASGILWSDDASMIVCFVTNVGTTPAKISSSQIFDSDGKVFASWNSCFHATLAPGASCSIQAPVPQGAGRIEADVAKGHLRGTCQLSGKGNVIIASNDMR